MNSETIKDLQELYRLSKLVYENLEVLRRRNNIIYLIGILKCDKSDKAVELVQAFERYLLDLPEVDRFI